MSPSLFRQRLPQLLPWLLVLAGAALAVAAYSQALRYSFSGDDIRYISANRILLNLEPTELWRLLTRPYNSFSEFLPLRDLSYWIDIKLFGLDPAPYRLHNILLYLLCLPLLYAVTAGLWRYSRPADASHAPWVAAVVTALFAVHPALVESVIWISGRKYILTDFLSLLAFWFAIKTRQPHGLSSRYAAATLLTFIAVILSKSSFVGIAPIIALLWLCFWLDIPASQRRRTLLFWPAAIMLLALFLLKIFIINAHGVSLVPDYFGIEAVYRSLAVLGGLTRISLTPGARHFIYPVFEDPWFPVMIALGAVMLLAATWGIMVFLRRRSFAGFALSAFSMLCLPYLQLIPTTTPSLVADRYIALAIWPAIMLVVCLAWRLKSLPRALVILAFALPWAFQIVERPCDWRNDETLTAPDIRAYPGYFPLAYNSIISTQLPQGLYRQAIETAGTINTPEMRTIIVRMIQLDQLLHTRLVPAGKPHEAVSLLTDMENELQHPPPQSLWNIPLIFNWFKLSALLAREWNFLAHSFPDDVAVRYSAGMYLFNHNLYSDALPHFRMAANSQDLPAYVRGTALKNFGLALLGSGYAADAVVPLRAALTQSPPDLSAYCVLSDVYESMGMPDESRQAEANCPWPLMQDAASPD